MSQNCNKSLDFIMGALVGGLLGGATSLLVAPKSGKELREDISDAYEDITEKAQELTKQVKRARNGFDHDLNYLLLGGLAGAGVGAVTALLSAPASGRDLRDSLACTTHKWAKNLNQVGRSAARSAENQTSEFKEIIKEVAEKLLEKTDHKHGTNFHNRVDDILDFANLGLRFFRSRK